jgi:hypothetical protein
MTKKKLEKKRIKMVLEGYISEELMGSFESIEAQIEMWREKYAEKGYFDLELERDYGYDEHSLVGYRWETDAEFKRRQERSRKAKEAAKARERAKKEKKEAKELAEYERLKKKYEGKTNA